MCVCMHTCVEVSEDYKKGYSTSRLCISGWLSSNELRYSRVVLLKTKIPFSIDSLLGEQSERFEGNWFLVIFWVQVSSA